MRCWSRCRYRTLLSVRSHGLCMLGRPVLVLLAMRSLAGTAFSQEAASAAPTGYNVLFIAVDDMRPVMNDPDRKWKTAAFSQCPRPGHYPAEEHIRQMGYSMRTERYRYTEWRDHKTGEVLARELYDYHTDPQGNENIAGRPENAQLVEQLAGQLAQGWRGALPQH